MIQPTRKCKIYKAGGKVRILLKEREACSAFACVQMLHGVHFCFLCAISNRIIHILLILLTLPHYERPSKYLGPS